MEFRKQKFELHGPLTQKNKKEKNKFAILSYLIYYCICERSDKNI